MFIDIFIVTGKVLHMNYGVFFDKQLRSWHFWQDFLAFSSVIVDKLYINFEVGDGMDYGMC